MVPLLERHPKLTPSTLLEHLQEQKPDQDWSSVKRTLQGQVQHWKALHGLAPEVMVPLARSTPWAEGLPRSGRS